MNRLGAVVVEARDPRALARFYANLLDLPITSAEDDWVDVGHTGATRLSFQLAPEHQPPAWPDPASPMQFHLDIDVDDIDAAEATALELGATRLPWPPEWDDPAPESGERTDGFRVYADPAGHPFCLCRA
ncbi:hypothetical protein FHX37_3374 [Haloactinospora alba]|uniref:VOC domain-containing protein n=1 Tax=Haloactinospora alba TaxID=405555 RepID=A0A543NNE3_9ACTN|nr:VOC family protein [Haloactinospora alba]TQN33359.1 hypothetical protein FHX37_3374 [Haloactinospora alba]